MKTNILFSTTNLPVICLTLTNWECHLEADTLYICSWAKECLKKKKEGWGIQDNLVWYPHLETSDCLSKLGPTCRVVLKSITISGCKAWALYNLIRLGVIRRRTLNLIYLYPSVILLAYYHHNDKRKPTVDQWSGWKFSLQLRNWAIFESQGLFHLEFLLL